MIMHTNCAVLDRLSRWEFGPGGWTYVRIGGNSFKFQGKLGIAPINVRLTKDNEDIHPEGAK